MKKALILGISGQDGSYLAESLLRKNYDVHGLVRRASTSTTTSNLASVLSGPLASKLTLHAGDITESQQLARLLKQIRPDEIYHLAAQSHVGLSFEIPELTCQTIAQGTLNVLEAIRTSDLTRQVRLVHAASSEMFGRTSTALQNEHSPFRPLSPYASAKVFAYNLMKNYRESYGIFAANAIFFNHESPRRGKEFVTRKVTWQLAEIVAGRRKNLELGNLDAARDWGYAPEYMEAMHLIANAEAADDFVIATGETHTVRELVDYAFSLTGLNWQNHTQVTASNMRPNDVVYLAGDAAKAKEVLGWSPRTKFHELIRLMVENDVKSLNPAFRLNLPPEALWPA